MSGYPPYPARLPGRPLGVAILAVLVGIFGLFILLAGIVLLAVTVGLALVGAHGFGLGVFGLSDTLAAVVLTILGIITLALAIGLWKLEMWALALSLIVFVILAVVAYLSGSILELVVAIALIVYLAAVHRHFL